MSSQDGVPSAEGDGWSAGQWDEVYQTLRELAGGVLRNDRARRELRPTDLVHEAYLRLAGALPEHSERLTFIAAAVRVLRQVVVDEVRRLEAQKRGGGWSRITWSDHQLLADLPDVEVLDLDAALEKLAVLDPRASRVVELRFFGGLEYAEIGQLLGISPHTARQDWRHARSWLRRELGRGEGE